MSPQRSRPSPGDGHRRPRWLAVPFILLAIGVGLLVVGLAGSPRAGKPPVAPAREGAQVSPRVLAGEQGDRRRHSRLIDAHAAPPRWLRVPAIGVSAPVVPLGLNADGSLHVPDRWGTTGWYTGGPEPGERGPAVVTGHVDSRSGPAVFYRLGELHRGDVIFIRRADRTSIRFRVQGSERWPKDRFPTRRVYHSTSTAALRLITCGGGFNSATGHYLDNTIVYATRTRARPRGERR